MKILVTGVAGFIGSNLADRLLQEGHQVLGVDNLAYGVREQIPSGVDFHQVDIRSKEMYSLFKGIDFVYHLAAKNCITDCQEDPVETADINVTGTTHVFEASRQAGVKKVIYAESSALYEGSDVMPTPESEVHPQSFYSISKICGMHIADAYRRYFGLESTALRYFCVYGPRQDYRRTIPPVMSAFIINLSQGKSPIIYGTGEKRRDFVHVNDVNDFHLQCMVDERTNGHVYNLGSGENYSVNEIYKILCELMGKNLPPQIKKDLPGEAQVTLADISAAKKLGWQPRVKIEEGLQGMIQYLEENVLPDLKS